MKKKELILVLGGARSGKSTFAQQLAQRIGERILFVATAEVTDQAMQERIERHRAERPLTWPTIEEPLYLDRVLQAHPQYDVILIDCLSLWINNLMFYQDKQLPDTVKESCILDTTSRLLDVHAQIQATLILVSNEVGMGIVPPSPLGRAFRDLQGRVNHLVTSRADRVYLVIAGLAVDLIALGAERI